MSGDIPLLERLAFSLRVRRNCRERVRQHQLRQHLSRAAACCLEAWRGRVLARQADVATGKVSERDIPRAVHTRRLGLLARRAARWPADRRGRIRRRRRGERHTRIQRGAADAKRAGWRRRPRRRRHARHMHPSRLQRKRRPCRRLRRSAY